MQFKSFRQRGGGWVIGQSVLMLAVLTLGVLCPGRSLGGGSVPIGVLLLVMSAVVGLAAVRVLGASRTAYPTPVPQARLIQHGVYRYMRHPLYTSVLCASASWGLLWQSGAALAAVGFLALFLNAKARFEEACLREKFPEYASYQQRVRRFIPWVYSVTFYGLVAQLN